MKIAKVLGTDELFDYIDKYDLELDSHYNGILGRYPKVPWRKFVNPDNEHLVSVEAVDFLSQCLKYDYVRYIQAERITPRDAFDHEYFKPIVSMYKDVQKGRLSGKPGSHAYETSQILLNSS